ncbi:DNA-processing protein DprA [Silvimonas amylolytica]|uniref:DNA processing protein DprA n=1 Tax=Silvimonas amylolytica TaxID=449663 RepID=A0ABQ2PKG3_9NEIS|nr:DNA-processing protein DprA [Silvimonas amylolytica]GGP26104.1 DNA processing protein DprA [Silvimonas amylolytica]
MKSDDADVALWLRFALVPGIGPRRQSSLLQAFKTPQAALAASFYDVCNVLGDNLAARTWCAAASAPPPDTVSRTQEWLSAPGHHLLTLADDAWPASLLDLPDAPCVLFCMGNLALLKHTALAVVGSRNATPQGIEHAEQFSAAVSAAGIGIVSGLAAGIDAAAHRGGLAGPGSTIAVIGTGPERVYPASNRALAHRIAEQGVIVSEFGVGTEPKPGNFPRRNRLIAALGKGCLVVEAALQSGSLITARQANEMGRDVFAIPGSIHSPQAKGCHYLIKEGARLTESVDDILDELGWDSGPVQKGLTLADPVPLPDGEDGQVLAAAGYDPVTVDELVSRCGLTADRLCAILLGLELQGAILALPGNRYQRRA